VLGAISPNLLQLFHTCSSLANVCCAGDVVSATRATQFLKLRRLRHYKTTLVHALQPHDQASRVHFSSCFLQFVGKDEIDPQLIYFSDEESFHFRRYKNKQNNHYWNSQHPHLIQEVQLHPMKAGVWSAVRARRIAGRALFNETINCERYEQDILGKSFPELTAEERLYGWFQQDSATAHTARMSM
jgi:hypothetical protein